MDDLSKRINMFRLTPTVGKKLMKSTPIKSKSGAAKFERTMKKGLGIPGYNSGGSMSKDRLTQKDVEAATKALTYQRAVKNNKDKDRLTRKDVEAAAKAVGYLSGGQAKLDKNKDGKISGKDFAILRKEKAKGRGKGLQDEKLKPGKVKKAALGALMMKKFDPRVKSLKMNKGGETKKEKKIAKVMKEYKEGKLHSGSKKGPKVKSKKQAIAIALSEARKKSGKKA